MPHHKSTERLEVSIKKQIVSLEESIREAKMRKHGSTRIEWTTRREGIPQIALSGPTPHVFSFFEKLTGLTTSIFEVHTGPVVGIYKLEGLSFQIVLCPYGHGIGRSTQERILNLIRSSDLLLIDLPPSSWTNYWMEFRRWALDHNLEVSPKQALVEIKMMPTGGVRVVGKSNNFSQDDLTDFLRGYGILNCLVRVSTDATIDDVEAVIFGRTFKKCLFVIPRGSSPTDGIEPNSISYEAIFSSPSLFVDRLLYNLNLVRVYTMSSSGVKAQHPLLLKQGSTVIQVARNIHKDLWLNFKYAKLWRKGASSPIRVGRDFIVMDEDVVEVFD